MTSWVPAIVSVLSTLGLGGVVVTGMTLRQTRRKLAEEANKTSGEAASVLTSSAISLLEPLRTQIASLAAQVASRGAYVEVLKTQLKAAGIAPLPDPADLLPQSPVDLNRP